VPLSKVANMVLLTLATLLLRCVALSKVAIEILAPLIIVAEMVLLPLSKGDNVLLVP
jgi:hypothetical protein